MSDEIEGKYQSARGLLVDPIPSSLNWLYNNHIMVDGNGN